ncbi:hypothetical protein DFH07DRAFT_937921 [Mycena maculata]|uniref:F-box domain-containing protein n=1 Tax=Mycena maculata TaxID=230809 RepID=A0AAD7JSP8_9AGAR|nr:hypothetical protein DFH07DRAFT_937921 [Mycena maculata]
MKNTCPNGICMRLCLRLPRPQRIPTYWVIQRSSTPWAELGELWATHKRQRLHYDIHWHNALETTRNVENCQKYVPVSTYTFPGQLERDSGATQIELQSFRFPILTLPLEITTEIFIRCFPDEPEHPRQTHAPLLFLGVCKEWKHIALSIPTFWATLYLDVDRLRITMPYSEGFHIVRTWFDRAGNCPLTFILHGWVSETFVEDNCINEFIHSYAPRFHRLSLHIELEDLNALEDFSFPLLQDLTIGPRFTEEDLASKTTLRSASMLRSAPLLADCKFGVLRDTRADHDGTLEHPSLQSFSLLGELDSDDCTAAIFSHITLPSLHTLRIAKVRDLDSDGSFFPEQLRCMATITDLELRGVEDVFARNALQLLAKDGKDYLPQLQNLAFVPPIGAWGNPYVRDGEGPATVSPAFSLSK